MLDFNFSSWSSSSVKPNLQNKQSYKFKTLIIRTYYIILAGPVSFNSFDSDHSPSTMANNSSHFPGFNALSLAIVVTTTAGALLLIYHFILIRCCSRRQTVIAHQQMPQNSLSLGDHFDQEVPPNSMEDSITELIPAYKFSKDMGLVSKSEDVTCAICLCEFNDGEAIRVLPECLHSFHVHCIDNWLYSHANCPLCRADTPVHHIVERLPANSSMGNVIGL